MSVSNTSDKKQIDQEKLDKLIEFMIDEKILYVNINNRHWVQQVIDSGILDDIFFNISLQDIPLYINAENPAFRAVAKWRLHVGK